MNNYKNINQLTNPRIKTIFEDGTSLAFANGAFDNYCIYYIMPDGTAIPPHDREYFKDILYLGNKYGRDYIYNLFIGIFRVAKKGEGSPKCYERCKTKFKDFNEDYLLLAKTFSILYMGMIAEENRIYKFCPLCDKSVELDVEKHLKKKHNMNLNEFKEKYPNQHFKIFPAKIGKRAKRLGIHQVLIENIEPEIAANFSKNKKWRELDKECKKRGF